MSSVITLANAHGMQANIYTKGAALISLHVPVQGIARPVVLNCGVEQYDAQTVYLNAIVGRYANRIANSTFEYNGERYQVVPSQGPHCLHGGLKGFDKLDWRIIEQQADSVRLGLTSPDGDQGFPGKLDVVLTYTLREFDLAIDIQGTVTKPSPVNLTSHAYFNLDGKRSDIRNHQIQVKASKYLPIDSLGIPQSDEPIPVNSAMDLRAMKPLQQNWLSHEQLMVAKGYDHCYVLDHLADKEPAAQVVSADGKLTMLVFTNQPGLQVYTSNYLAGTPCADGSTYHDYEAVCLESEQLPDSPNHDGWGNPWLLPDQTYHHSICYRFVPQKA